MILYRSADVRNKIIDIFETSKRRRVAIAAFVGDGAEAYIPNPRGVQVICWPKAGGTNPDAIRRLIEKGARVYFCDSLHMKVYWTSDKGAVITSANLSQNALGSGNLREVGIWVEPGQVDIDRILRPLNYWEVSAHDLHELDDAHREYHVRNKLWNRESQALAFPEWYGSAHRVEWRLCWWSPANTKLARGAKPILEQTYGVSHAEDFAYAEAQTEFPKNSWVLCFTDTKNQLVNFSWLYVDQVFRVRKSDREAYQAGFPYQAIQVWPMKRYTLPPFRVDNRFRKALRRAAKKLTWDKLESEVKPTSSFLKLVYQYYG
ncbi:MAG: hypothetical protein ABSE79_20840 [Terriglobia bacterium]|jgi:phosphatidylserine/phosphatidylglycerophosphate/cardiolipin synthase-like enzyme